MKRNIQTTKSSIKADAIYDDYSEKVTILIGSEMRKDDTTSLSYTYKEKRKQLIQNGTVEFNSITNKFVFKREQEFDSPSPAICVLIGAQESLDGWIDLATGLNLQELKNNGLNIAWEDVSSLLTKSDFLRLIEDRNIFSDDRLRALFLMMPHQKTGVSIVALGEKLGTAQKLKADIIALSESIMKSENLTTQIANKPYTVVCKGYRTKSSNAQYIWGIKDPLFEALKETFSPEKINQFLAGFKTLNVDKSVDVYTKNNRKKSYPLNQILYGPPGTGKTFNSVNYALSILLGEPLEKLNSIYQTRKEMVSNFNEFITKKNIVFTTFHQSFGYEDFIEGLRPKEVNGVLNFEIKEGIFKKLVNEAITRHNEKFVLIIDEINRGNISRILGELISLIEEDKRLGKVNELTATLPISQQKFGVPINLYIIGTMNTADKSISLVDTAIRRRFEFIEISPDSSLVKDDKIKVVLEKINQSIEKENPNLRDLLIGHSYFIDINWSELEHVINRQIIPLLYEYFYDNESKVEKILVALESLNIKVNKIPYKRLSVIVS
jgi:5-methylcytosine-specific restriction endonuclease McrBC GTP-binding regulatory subunit McrB